jgi:hypothetical protein
MPLPSENFSADHALKGVLKALLGQVELGMTFEHARGAFREVAMRFGFSPHAPCVKNGNYALYTAWRAYRLKTVDDLLQQGYLPLSSPDPNSSLVWEDVPFSNPGVSTDEAE